MKKDSVLVTGGAGFIGSSFVRLMLEQEHRVIVLDKLTYCGKRENLEDPLLSRDCELVVGDICDFELVRSLIEKHKPLGIFNFAAESHVDNSIRGPQVFVQTNIVGTFTLLEAVRSAWPGLDDEFKKRFRFVHVSTDEVFGQLSSEGYFSETTSYHPSSPYSASKAAADHLVSAWHHTYGIPTIVTNCSNNYGPRQFPEKLIPVVITSALMGRPIPVYGQGLNVRDWVHVQDHCQGIQLAYQKGQPGQSYCFGGRSERRNIDIVKSICTILDTLVPRAGGVSYQNQITFVEDRLGHDFRYAIDDSKARNELGYTPSIEVFEDGLLQTVTWYLKFAPWLKSELSTKFFEEQI